MNKNPVQYFDKHNLIARTQQSDVLDQINDAWDHYDYFILSAPTGVGKTYIALAIAEALDQSYILTGTKMLQEQYMSESSSIVNIKGRGNYPCAKDSNFNCDAAPCHGSKAVYADCMAKQICPYVNQRNKAQESQTMITNYMYFLYGANSCSIGQNAFLTGHDEQDQDDEKVFTKRNAIIMDEAHELDSHLVSYSELTINLNEMRKKFNISSEDWDFSEDEMENNKIISEIQSAVITEIDTLKQQLEDTIGDNGALKTISANMVNAVKSINNTIEELKKYEKGLQVYHNTDSKNWLMTTNLKDREVKLSPINCHDLFNYYIQHLGYKFIFMSATIGNPDVYTEELGLDPSKVKYIETDTPFESTKSPVYGLNIGKLNYKEIDNTLPLVYATVEALMDRHKGEKGIIHTGNYRICTDIYANVKPEYKDKLICKTNDDKFMNNQDLIEMHKMGDGTVLMSPSMHTGVDLYDDLSRWQIIVKLPFLSLGDPRIKLKSNLNSSWYRNKMWCDVMQASGRSTRSEEDYSTTYILDSSLLYFLQKDINNLPDWFLERLLPYLNQN